VLPPDIPKEKESENVLGIVSDEVPTDETFPAVVVREVGWALVLEGENVEVLWPGIPKENEFEGVGMVNEGTQTEVTLPTVVVLRGVVRITLLVVGEAGRIVVMESVREETPRGVDD
jgi:hypothetical protein